MGAAAMPPSRAVLFVSLSVALLSALLAALLSRVASPRAPATLLQQLAAGQFAWGRSTTPIPISSASVLAKALLSGDAAALPPPLRPRAAPPDTLALQPLRDFANAHRLRRVRAFCSARPCDVAAPDPVFGLTPLHLAALSGDPALADWLRAAGAGPVPDHAGRLPANLSFASFIANAKAARPPGDDCDFPVVDFARDAEHARREVRRLVAEGEPVLMRAAYAHYASDRWSVRDWIRRFGQIHVTVGSVPYARAFNLTASTMPLAEYYDRFVLNGPEHPSYVFNKHPAVCAPGYAALTALVEHCFPLELVAHPHQTGGLDGIHFFFGRRNSGAPFHIHADAINAAVNGRKRWFVFTPRRTLYSRKTVKRWVDEDYPALPDGDKPLECIQRPGDVVYVPLDWGHAVLNLDDDTFGYALELLNRRDTLSHIWR